MPRASPSWSLLQSNGRHSAPSRRTISRMLGLPPGYVERAIARTLAQNYPWLTKVERLPEVGVIAQALPEWPAAANDPQFSA